MGIGASAGGLEALNQFFSELPADTGMAFVVVQHLDPKHESHLPQLLSSTSKMPVVAIRDGMVAAPNRVFVIPPDRVVLLSGNLFRLQRRPESNLVPLPLNIFFRSLAAERQHLSIGVVLSGTGSDGTLGVGDIKAVGGITFAQDEKSAQFHGMPLSAIQSGHVDLVLPPGDIARELARIGTNPLLLKVPLAPEAPEESEESGATQDIDPNNEFKQILEIMRDRANVDFGAYRVSTLQRRILRRMVIRKIDSMAAYIELLHHDSAEPQSLFNDLLINVTSFFRDPEMFDVLKARVFPELVSSRSGDEPIRIWVAGCSTGQEVYSLAIALSEFLEPRKHRPQIQIFASDISDSIVLQAARAGSYPESIRSEVSSDRLQKYFTHEEGGYRIAKSIRDMCVFARQNLIADPPFSRMDLVTCRNVLIYLSIETQKKLIPLFHYALNDPGYLVLGTAESIGTYTELFSTVDKKQRIFSRKPALHRKPPSFRFVGRQEQSKSMSPAPIASFASKGDLQSEVDRILLQRYAPGAVLINGDLDVLQFQGRTSPWLEPPHGEARLNIAQMARQSLFLEIRNGVNEARESGRRVRKENVRGGDAPEERVHLEVIPLLPRQGRVDPFLVIFESVVTERSQKPAEDKSQMPAEQEVLELRDELRSAHEYVQSVIHQQGAYTEELRSANEEILSANEELQSSNEELETSKEELQSTNEELTTVNQELQNRNFELAQLTDDLLNLLSSMRMPILMISGDLLIRRFTPSAAKTFNLLATDIGRPLDNIRPNFELPNLLSIIRNVIGDVATVELEVLDRNQKWHLLRIHPYRTTDNKIDGAVLLLLDIHSIKVAAEHLIAASDYTKAIIEYSLDPLLLLDTQLNIESANRAYCELAGCSAEDIVGRSIHAIHDGAWNDPQLREKLARVVHQGELMENHLLKRVLPNAGPRSLSIRARLLNQRVDKPRIIVIFTDVTSLEAAVSRERQLGEAERSARMQAEQANRIKDEFLAMLSHELRTPLNAVLGWTKVLKSHHPVDSSELSEALERIESATSAQIRMVNDLLDISRIAAGKMDLQLKTVNLVDIVESAAEMFMPAAKQKNIELVLHCEPPGSVIVADPQRLQQTIANLLSNAVKFTPPQGRVEVSLSDAGHAAKIVVRDTGPGIAPEFQAHLFERFRQADRPPATNPAAGLGLGLAIVKHLVTLQGGTVQYVRDDRRQGAEFVITLPYTNMGSGVGQPAAPVTSVPKRTEAADLPGLCVLLVDDDPDACAIARRIFEEHKIKVFIALSAHEGLDILKHERPDIIVSDIGMPNQDGYELMRQIRKLPPEKGGNTPAIALTAFARPKDRKQALAVGYQRHLAKPVDPFELLTVIATLTSANRKTKP